MAWKTSGTCFMLNADPSLVKLIKLYYGLSLAPESHLIIDTYFEDETSLNTFLSTLLMGADCLHITALDSDTGEVIETVQTESAGDMGYFCYVKKSQNGENIVSDYIDAAYVESLPRALQAYASNAATYILPSQVILL